jgi:hypothetical protein
MKYISSADEFFGQPNSSNLLESIAPQTIWETLGSLSFTQYIPATSQEAAAVLNHQVYLLEAFDTIEEINRCENLLIRHGYNPVFLTLEGAYLETLEALSPINEGLMDMAKSFLSTMTEGGSAIGILQFVLDIIGIIPFDAAGIPANEVANFINALISFYRGNFLTGLISLGMAIPAVGAVVFAPIKFAMKPFAKLGEKLIGALWGGAAAKGAVQEFKAGALAIDPGAKASTGIFEKLAAGLGEIGKFLATTGIKIIRGLADLIGKALNKASLGIIPKPTGLLKWLDELALKTSAFSKSATEASELLLKDEAKLTAAADKAAVDAETKAIGAGEAQAEINKITNKFADVPAFTSKMESDIIKSEGFQKLLTNGASKSIQEKYLMYAAYEKMIGNMLAKEGQVTGKSLIELLKSPNMIAELQQVGFRGFDKYLIDAVKAGDSAALSKLLSTIIETPGAAKLLSPNVAKSMAIFREAPELLIQGPKMLKTVQASIAKLEKVAPKVALSSKALVAFLLKSFIKSNECLSYLGKGTDPNDVFNKVTDAAADKTSSVALNLAGIQETLSLIAEEDSSDSITMEEIDGLKESNPEAYAAISAQVKSAKEVMTKLAAETKPNNPCAVSAAVATAATGALLSQPKGMYSAKGGGEKKDITTEEEMEPLTAAMKNVLNSLGEASDIEPQHPMSSLDPYSQAYLADAWDFKNNSYSPNTDNASRLDATLDELERSGELNASMRDDVKKETLAHWENGTVPKALQTNQEQVKEGKGFFKIGKLVTKR